MCVIKYPNNLCVVSTAYPVILVSDLECFCWHDRPTYRVKHFWARSVSRISSVPGPVKPTSQSETNIPLSPNHRITPQLGRSPTRRLSQTTPTTTPTPLSALPRFIPVSTLGTQDWRRVMRISRIFGRGKSLKITNPTKNHWKNHRNHSWSRTKSLAIDTKTGKISNPIDPRITWGT